MNIQDFTTLKTWLRAGVSLAEAERVDRIGLVDNVRFSERVLDWYRFIHEWSAPRLSSPAQDRLFERRGSVAVWRRINRVRALCNKHFGTEWGMFSIYN